MRSSRSTRARPVNLRVPLHVLKSVKFPVSGREIDLTAADAAIQQALTQLGSEITIWAGRPLVPSRRARSSDFAIGPSIRELPGCCRSRGSADNVRH